MLPWQQASAPRGCRARHSLESRTGSVGVRVHSARLAGRAPDNRGALCSSRGWLIGPGPLLGLLSKPLVSVLSRPKRRAFQVTWRQKGFRSQLGRGLLESSVGSARDRHLGRLQDLKAGSRTALGHPRRLTQMLASLSKGKSNDPDRVHLHFLCLCAQAGRGPTVPEQQGFKGRTTCSPRVTQSLVQFSGRREEAYPCQPIYTHGLIQPNFAVCLL